MSEREPDAEVRSVWARVRAICRVLPSVAPARALEALFNGHMNTAVAVNQLLNWIETSVRRSPPAARPHHALVFANSWARGAHRDPICAVCAVCALCVRTNGWLVDPHRSANTWSHKAH